jgi:hypothetical protein
VASQSGTPEIHIFGVYETRSDHSFDYRPQGVADITIERQGKPLVLVLSSYEPTKWRLHKSAGVNIETVILNGYHEQQVEGTSGIITIINRSGVNSISPSAYKWPSKGKDDTRILVSWVEKLIGTEITSFHGCYRATKFTLKDTVGNKPVQLTVEQNLHFNDFTIVRQPVAMLYTLYPSGVASSRGSNPMEGQYTDPDSRKSGQVKITGSAMKVNIFCDSTAKLISSENKTISVTDVSVNMTTRSGNFYEHLCASGPFAYSMGSSDDMIKIGGTIKLIGVTADEYNTKNAGGDPITVKIYSDTSSALLATIDVEGSVSIKGGKTSPPK